jgi:hypothetical protein
MEAQVHLAATHKAARKLFSFDQFQIALPLNGIGIMLRDNRHPNPVDAGRYQVTQK